MQFFNIECTFIELWGYPVSYVEFIGTLFGLVSVYFASRANILTWPFGIINEIFLFILFFQVQLYADMFLQVYFFVVTLYGWYNWKSRSNSAQISEMKLKYRLIIFAFTVIATIISGYLFSNIHLYLPVYFKIAASYPLADSFIMASSIVATVLLARKKIETWILWIAVDITAVIIYYQKEIYFLALEYFVFLGMACYGLYNWNKKMQYG